jgi:hypothetical protein
LSLCFSNLVRLAAAIIERWSGLSVAAVLYRTKKCVAAKALGLTLPTPLVKVVATPLNRLTSERMTAVDHNLKCSS